ncbi:MAG TPA: C10 family peptidase, partial [Candidatus Sulfotelmatobacter sp.]|nr:C10 family peptidase [Candidatus Sulfotelmatobacter sp.]
MMTRSLWFSMRYLLALAVVLLPSLCLSAEVNRETGKQVAEKFMMEQVTAHGNWGGSSAPFITDVETVLHENKVVAYNMKVHPSGHILVPYHDEFSPVLLYSETSDFIPERISEKHSVESWVIPEITATYKKITERMATGKATVGEDSQVGKAWKRLLAQDQSATLEIPLTTTVGPLIGATWSQGYPFNYYTPFNSCGGTNDNTLTGCVATAMGQLMKYW